MIKKPIEMLGWFAYALMHSNTIYSMHKSYIEESSKSAGTNSDKPSDIRNLGRHTSHIIQEEHDMLQADKQELSIKSLSLV